MKKVLIVDDSKFSREVNKKLLKKLEYNVVGEAIDGVDGVQKFKKLSLDLIVTDLEMPNLDGISMIKEIRSYNSDIKIIVVSSIVNSQIIQEVVKLKASVIKKPIKEDRLLNAIKLLETKNEV